MRRMEYKISLAACAGRSHLSAGRPCQDKVALYRNGCAVCAALADGAGSCASSDLGAACVTQCTSELLCRRFDDLWAMEDGVLAEELIQTCTRVLCQQEPPIYELASTLLFFAGHADGRYLSGHLGDGVQVFVQNGTALVFSPPENGEYQNETFFITADDAAEHLRLHRGRLEDPGALLMMSDGMAESLYQQSTGEPAPACGTIARWLEDGDEETISQALEFNMRQIFSKRSGDDLGLVVIAWGGQTFRSRKDASASIHKSGPPAK